MSYANECLRRHVSGGGNIELLMFIAQRFPLHPYRGLTLSKCCIGDRR